MHEQDPAIQQLAAEPTIIQINSAPTEPTKPIEAKHTLSNKVFAGFMAVGTLFGVMGAVDIIKENEARAQTIEASKAICPAPSQAAITAVTKLIDKPQWEPTYPYGTTRGQAHTIYRTEKAAIEKSLNVTIESDNNLINDMFEYGTGPYPKPFNYYLSAVQKFAMDYGVDVELLTPTTAAHVELGKPPQAKQLETTTAKEVMLSIAEGLSAFPTEFIKQYGVHIYLASDLVSKDKTVSAAAYAETGGLDNTVVEGVDTPLNADVTDHEIGHLVSARLCGGPVADANDPAYVAHNGGDIYYDTMTSNDEPRSQRAFSSFVASSTISYDTLESDVANLAINADTLMCKVHLKRLQKLGPMVRVDSDYAYTNVVEDKAQILRHIFNPYGYLDSIDPITPVVRYKTIIELARLYQQDPNLVKYYTTLNQRLPSLAEPCPSH